MLRPLHAQDPPIRPFLPQDFRRSPPPAPVDSRVNCPSPRVVGGSVRLVPPARGAASISRTEPISSSPVRTPEPRGRCVRRAGGMLFELVAGLHVELAECLAEVVVDGVGADEQLRGDLSVGGTVGGEAGDLCFLRGEGIAGLDGPLARVLADGPEFDTGELDADAGAAERLDCLAIERLGGFSSVSSARGRASIPSAQSVPLAAVACESRLRQWRPGRRLRSAVSPPPAGHARR